MAEIIKQRFSTFNQTYEIKITSLRSRRTNVHDYAKNNSRFGFIQLEMELKRGNKRYGRLQCRVGLYHAAPATMQLNQSIKSGILLSLLYTSCFSLCLCGSGKFNDRYFINIASIGFDAEVVLKSRLFRKCPDLGPMAYILVSWQLSSGLKIQIKNKIKSFLCKYRKGYVVYHFCQWSLLWRRNETCTKS